MGEQARRCEVCGRRLRTEQSRRLGVGPVCWAKTGQPTLTRLAAMVREQVDGQADLFDADEQSGGDAG
jgi:hypothetical protein